MSRFVCASEVLKTNKYFAELESRQSANKPSIWWKSGMSVNVHVSVIAETWTIIKINCLNHPVGACDEDNKDVKLNAKERRKI